jgi:Xaa-Pro aminopeptidase
MNERRLDALVISLLPNIRYLTGFTGSHALVVVTTSGSWFLTDSRYAVQSAREVTGFRRIITRDDGWKSIAGHRLTQGCRRVGFESESVTYAQYALLRDTLPRVTLVPSRGVVEDLTITKDPCELSSIARAVEITDQVFREILPLIRPGVRELEIAAEISYRHRLHGADGDAFAPMVAAGERGAVPHARATERCIGTGVFVTLDFGSVVDGYCADLTRTVVVGRIGRRQRLQYAAVLAAQREAIEAASAGMHAADLDAVARSRIAAEGFGKYFTHSLGHGLGLRIHERPSVSALSREQLLIGSVITIEPGIYIPGEGGVRIEDDIVLTSSGCSVLTAAPKELMIL